MAFKRWKEASEDASDLNVIPVMNLFMVLIPFLLLGATFFQIGVIPTSTPTLSPSESDVPKTPKTVAVSLTINEEGMRIDCASTSLTPEELAALSSEWPKKSGKYQIDALQQELLDIKRQYPESNTITVLPHEELNYQTLVEVLDKTRNRKVGTNSDGEPVWEELFPVTIFSRYYEPEPDQEGVVPVEEGGGDEE